MRHRTELRLLEGCCLRLSFLFFPGQIVKPLPLTCPDFQDPFSLTEKPPAEFCLSPDGNSEAISIDLLQKKGEYDPQVKPGILLSVPFCAYCPTVWSSRIFPYLDRESARKESAQELGQEAEVCAFCKASVHEYTRIIYQMLKNQALVSYLRELRRVREIAMS